MERFLRRVAALLLTITVALPMRAAFAEELRVFTVVYDLAAGAEGQRKPVVGRSVTLFHAGKVYDYVDARDEVIVFEPTQRQFRVLKPTGGLVATVQFDEIRHLLEIPREETERQVASLSPSDADVAAMLQFQLNPQFAEEFDEAAETLILGSPAMRYVVRVADPSRPGVVGAYLEYADWVCRLNYLLHPSAILPEPRLALNASLRAKERLPASVELKTLAGPTVHLRAEHTVDFELNSQERTWIHQWETQLKTARQVPLREYQRVVLASHKK